MDIIDIAIAKSKSGATVSALSDAVQDLYGDVQDLQTGLASKVSDVQINGSSVVSGGVAEIPIAKTTDVGLIKVGSYGVGVNTDGGIYINGASSAAAKAGVNTYNPVVPVRQHESAFYGLAKVAGHDEKNSTLPVGTYTDEAKVAIQKMLGIYEAPWKLIDDFTLEEAGMPDKSVEPDGTPYNFRQVFVKVIYPANLETASGYGLYYFYDENNNNLLAETGKYAQNTAQMFKHMFLQKNANMTTLMYTRATSVGSYAMLYDKFQGVDVAFGNVRRILVNGTEPAGTQIQIYAQRAY